MTYYYRVRLGSQGVYADQCIREGFVGVDYGLDQDVGEALKGSQWEFNEQYIPVLQDKFPDKTKLGAGLSCGAIYTLGRGIAEGDIVLCPDATGQKIHLGQVAGPYHYEPAGALCHRRPVRWLDRVVDKSEFSDTLRASVNVPLTVVYLEHHGPEIQRLLDGAEAPALVASDPAVEDPIAFAMERHLEAFLVDNWAQTELGQEFFIAEAEGERVGQQFPTDTGPLDILAVSHDRKRLLVVELKKGRASDAVVGQILRYMGYIKSEVAEPGQTVEGVIIALDDDVRIRHALNAVDLISFYRYKIRFQLEKV